MPGGKAIRTISADLAVNTGDWNGGLRQAMKDLEKFQTAANAKLAKPAEMAGASSTPGMDPKGMQSQAADLAASLVPLGQQIQKSITGAMMPLNGFAARFSAQFDAVGGTIIALAKRIDDHLKFPAFTARMAEIRAGFKKVFADAEGNATTFGKRADLVFRGISAGNWVKSAITNFGSVSKKGISDMAKVKAPTLNFDQSSKSIFNVTNATNVASASMKNFGSQVALALGAFGLVFKAVGFIKNAIKNAMNLGETVSKVGTVFGEQTAGITANADDMAKRFGLVKGPLLDASASFGLMGKAAGLTGPAVGDLAKGMTNLAADAMSFYNIDFEDAQQKIRAGLAGEAEPLRALGVFLSEAAVEGEAFRLGLIKTKADLTESTKIQARASLITSGLKDATGDLDRTQNSASNQFRKFTGTITNLGSEIGAMLLPALTKGIGLFNEFATTVGSALESSKGMFEGWGATLSETFDVVGILVRNWRDVFEVARLGIYQGLVNIGEQFAVLGPNIATVAAYIGDNWYEILADSFNATLSLLKNFAKNFWAVGEAIGKFFADPTQGFQVDWTPMLDGFKSTVKEFPGLLKPELTDMSGEIAKATDRIGMNEAARTALTASKPAVVAKKGVVDPNAKEGPSAKAMADLAKFATDLTEKTATPLEQYSKIMGQAKEAFAKGQIDKKTFDRADAFAQKESGLDEANKPKFAGATDLKSSAGYSAIVQALSGKATGFTNLEKLNQQGNGLLNSINGGIQRMVNRAVNPGNQVGIQP